MLAMSIFSRQSFWVVLVVGGGLLVRVIAVSFLNIEPTSDFAHYIHMATTMLDSGEMSDKFGNVAYYSAGYPLFLVPFFSVFGPLPETAQLVNAFLGGLGIWLVYLCAREIMPEGYWAVGAAALWAAYPPSILYAEYVAKENLMVPLLLGQTFLLLRYQDSSRKLLLALAIGLVYGAGMITGAAIVLTAAIIALVIVNVRDRHTSAPARWVLLLAAVAAAVISVSPWLAYTNSRLGVPLLNTNGPFNLYLGNNPANLTPYYMGIEDTPIGPDWHELRAEKGEVDAMNMLGDLAKQYMMENPAQTIRLALTKMATFWYPPMHSGKGGDASALETLIRKVWLVFYLAISALALIPLFYYKRWDQKLLILYGSIFAYCAIHGIAYVIFRYRLPVMSFICILASVGFYWSYSSFFRSEAK